ncbi:hypothetical protein [Actinoplanes sp. NPDC020271]|uniref:hypothetical protein n=1 Tax=Actinoplanes sp. NPDC020271 TaxID=3363896 RepID=UPI00379BE6B0
MTLPEKSRSTAGIVTTVGAGVVILMALTVLGTLAITRDDKPEAVASPATASAWDLEQAANDTEPEPAATTAAPGPTPAASDLTLTPKITRKQCFGSAGCHVDIKVEVGYAGPTLSEDDTWEVTYQVSGAESGPIVGTFELTGTKYDQDEISLSTRTSSTKISVKVTDIAGIPG